MIREALLHLPGIGPERLKRLRQAGVGDWRDLRDHPLAAVTGERHRDRLLAAVDACERALATDDLHFLVRALRPADQWRILGSYFDRATYFDIETTGLDYDSAITIIACYHRDALHTFVRGENLDSFLDLLEDVDLLVSFNGASFDVPRAQSAFHVPDFPCPHLDLRWMCYHRGLKGGLKSIEAQLDIHRPPDVQGVDGAQAVLMWQQWEEQADRGARALLERYCQADVLALPMVAAELLRRHDCQPTAARPDDIWQVLDRDGAAPPVAAPRPTGRLSSPLTDVADTPMKRRLRAHWRSRSRR